jgi:GDP-L-fucose synthase
LHVDDLADALVFLMENYSGEQQINIGWGEDLTIAELATTVAEVVGYTGKFRYATEKPDGVPQKLLDVSRLTTMGWQPRIPLRQGLANAYKWYVEHVAKEHSGPILKHELL